MTEPENSIALKRRIFSPATFISFGVGALIFAFLVTRFDINLADTWDRVRSADLRLYTLAFIIYYLEFPVRGYRWKLLVQNSHPQGTPRPLPSVFTFGQYMFLGWFINAISWFRIGDAYRGYLLSAASRLSLSRTMGSILAERILDMLVVTGLLAVAAVLLWTGQTAATTALLLVATTLAVLALLGVLGMALLGERLKGRLPAPLQRVYTNFHEGTLSSFRNLPLLVAASIVSWLFEVARLFLMTYALGLDVAIPLLLFTALAASLLSTAPITPGGVGIVEAGMTGIFMVALSRPDAISLTVLDRSAQYLSVIILGSLLFLARAVLSRRARATPEDESSTQEVSSGAEDG